MDRRVSRWSPEQTAVAPGVPGATAIEVYWQIVPGALKTCRVIGFDCALPFIV